jgi:threonine 3-dehydrogenase
MVRARFPGGGRIVVESTGVPEPGTGELLVRVEAAALCGSDRAPLERGSSATPGHEAAGVVATRGPGTAIAEGTRGAVYLVVYCGDCERCRSGSRGACLAKQGMLGFTRDGGFAEYELVPERCFLPVDSSLAAEDAVMLLDMTGTPMHALRRAGAMRNPPPSAAVVGAGPVGLSCVLTLRAIGVSDVIALDVAPYRLDFARRLGARVVESGGTARDRVADTAPSGFPLVIEASGNPGGQRLALDLVAAGGQLLVIGHAPAPLEVSSTRDLIEQERTILGSEYFDPGEFAENVQFVLDGRHSPSRLITHRFPLESLGDAYDVFWSGNSGKVLVYPHGLPEGDARSTPAVTTAVGTTAAGRAA